MAEWERVVRKLGDVVADMNAQRDIEAVLDRIAASLCELTGADAGGFVPIEDGRLRLVSMEGAHAAISAHGTGPYRRFAATRPAVPGRPSR